MGSSLLDERFEIKHATIGSSHFSHSYTSWNDTKYSCTCYKIVVNVRWSVFFSWKKCGKRNEIVLTFWKGNFYYHFSYIFLKNVTKIECTPASTPTILFKFLENGLYVFIHRENWRANYKSSENHFSVANKMKILWI